MLTRRLFAACALCAAGGFLATGAEAQTAAPPGFKRTIIKQTDGPMDGYVTVEARVDIEPGALVPRHTHPGIEFELCRRRRHRAFGRRRGRALNCAGRRVPSADRRAAQRQERSCKDCHRLDLRGREGQAARLARMSR